MSLGTTWVEVNEGWFSGFTMTLAPALLAVLNPSSMGPPWSFCKQSCFTRWHPFDPWEEDVSDMLVPRWLAKPCLLSVVACIYVLFLCLHEMIMWSDWPMVAVITFGEMGELSLTKLSDSWSCSQKAPSPKDGIFFLNLIGRKGLHAILVLVVLNWGSRTTSVPAFVWRVMLL